jgi:hypothetical protein
VDRKEVDDDDKHISLMLITDVKVVKLFTAVSYQFSLEKSSQMLVSKEQEPTLEWST